MKPSETKKALGNWIENFDGTAVEMTILSGAFIYINRLEAEVERLRKILTVCTKAKNDYANQLQQVIENLETAKSDAVKEFVERLETIAFPEDGCGKACVYFEGSDGIKGIYDILKETVGENNGK